MFITKNVQAAWNRASKRGVSWDEFVYHSQWYCKELPIETHGLLPSIKSIQILEEQGMSRWTPILKREKRQILYERNLIPG